MAKGAMLSVKRGKLGDAVGYNVSNSNNGEKQGWRIYQPVVSNPQTDAQVDQRLKLTAVNNLYRALKEVITRGQENKKYGDESRRAWLSRALGSQADVPVLAKGSSMAAPIKGVPIMYGSIPSLSPVWYEDEEYFMFVGITVNAGISLETVGGVSQVLVDNGYREGDQLTIVVGNYDEATSVIRWQVYDFYLDTADATQIDDVAYGLRFVEEGDTLCLGGLPGVGFLPNAAVAVSISRDGDGSHLRSTSFLAIGRDMEEAVYGISSAEQARRKATYRKTGGSSNNWQQVPGEGGGAVVRQQAVTNAGATVSVTALTYDSTANEYAKVAGTGGPYYIKGHLSDGTNPYVCRDASSLQAPTDATDANTINAVSSANVANGFRQWLLDNGVGAVYLVI